MLFLGMRNILFIAVASSARVVRANYVYLITTVEDTPAEFYHRIGYDYFFKIIAAAEGGIIYLVYRVGYYYVAQGVALVERSLADFGYRVGYDYLT